MLNAPDFPQSPADTKSRAPRSTLISRNVTISGHRTSVRLEPEMWSGLTEICRREGASLHEVCTMVALRKGENTSLTAAIRVFVMAYYRAAATEDGHGKAGHGYGIATLGNHSLQTPRGAVTTIASPASGYGDRMGGRSFSMSGGNTRGGIR